VNEPQALEQQMPPRHLLPAPHWPEHTLQLSWSDVRSTQFVPQHTPIVA
jgi:hypothetical protein